MQPGGCFIVATLEPTVQPQKRLMDNFSSTDAIMRDAKPVISRLMIAFTAGR